MVDGNTILTGIIIFATFVATLFLVKSWMRAARAFGLVGKDMNKYDKRKVAESGGVAVIFSIVFGLFFYIFLKTFLLQTETHFIELLAIAITVLLAGFIGFIDDILGWKKGLRQWQKPLLTIPIAFPLAILNVGHSVMNVPFIGNVDLGILYPLLIVPIAIIGASNGFNMLAGLNGLEAGMGALILGTLGIISLATGSWWLALVAFIAVAALIAFLLFNRYPARIFPGDSFTYAIGALIAVIAILGSIEKLAILLFLPYFIELGIKAKNKFQSECFGVPQKDGSLFAPKIKSLAHVAIRIAKTERGAVRLLLLAELVLAAIALLLYFY